MEKNNKRSDHQSEKTNLSLRLEKANQKIAKLKSQNLLLTAQRNQIFKIFPIITTLHKKVEKIFLIDDLYKSVLNTLISDLSMDAAAFIKINHNNKKVTFFTHKGLSDKCTLLNISCDFPKKQYTTPAFSSGKSLPQKFRTWIKKYFGISYFIWYPIIEDDDGILVLFVGNKSEDAMTKQPYSEKIFEILPCLISIFMLQRENIIKTEEMLLKKEDYIKFFAEIIGTSPISVITLDQSGKITYINPATAKVFGYTEEELKGKNLFMFHTENGFTVTHRKMLNTIKKGNVWRGELVAKKKDGVLFYVYSSYYRILNNEGKFLAFVGFQEDISELKLAEKKLEKSKKALQLTAQRYRQLFTHSPVSLWEEDASALNPYFDHLRKSGVKDFKAYFESHPEAVQHCASLIKIIDVNNASLRMYKAERKVDLFKDLNKIFTEKSYEAFKKLIVGIVEGKTYLEVEGIQKTLMGEEIYVMLCFSIAPGYEKTLSKVFISITDITQRKKAEEALSNYKEELRYLSSKLVITEERERRKIASAIHDNIGQTLAISKIKLEMLKKSLASQQYALFIDDIIRFIDQTLNNTRSLIFDLSPRILYELGLEAAIETLIRKIRAEHNIMCHYSDDGKNKPLSEDISIFLYRAIRELIINAIKHAKAKNLKVTIGKENDKIQIFVEDDGIGFERTKLKSSFKNGFGLFNIKEELIYINGDINIDTASGKGTKITIVAPLCESVETIRKGMI